MWLFVLLVVKVAGASKVKRLSWGNGEDIVEGSVYDIEDVSEYVDVEVEGDVGGVVTEQLKKSKDDYSGDPCLLLGRERDDFKFKPGAWSPGPAGLRISLFDKLGDFIASHECFFEISSKTRFYWTDGTTRVLEITNGSQFLWGHLPNPFNIEIVVKGPKTTVTRVERHGTIIETLMQSSFFVFDQAQKLGKHYSVGNWAISATSRYGKVTKVSFEITSVYTKPPSPKPMPLPIPSAMPTQRPTHTTKEPLVPPTLSPVATDPITMEPSIPPTLSPVATDPPTKKPSPSPTLSLVATDPPTKEPSPSPTLSPIATDPPTKEPSPSPTLSPVATNPPTTEPSPLPTLSPVAADLPTMEPSLSPTSLPTESPTTAATARSATNTTYYINPLDSRLLSWTNGDETTTVSGLRDVNGLPLAVYAIQYDSSNSSTTNKNVSHNLARYEASVVTVLDVVPKDDDFNVTTLRVCKVIVEGVTFDFRYENDTMSVVVTSRLGTFESTAVSGLPAPMIERDFEELESEPLHDLSPYLNGTASSVLTKFTDAAGNPLPDEDVVFIVEEENNGAKTLLTAKNAGSGQYAATLPFYPAPVSLSGWRDLITTGIDLEFEYACRVLTEYRDVEVSNLVCGATTQSLAGETSVEALDVVRVCPIAFASWETSCAVISSDRRRLQDSIVEVVDSATTGARNVTAYGRALNDPSSSMFSAGSRTSIPASTDVALDGSFFQQIPLQASSISTPTARSTCNGFTNAGNNIPDTSRVELGVSEGSFLFTYETFSVPDRIIITHGGVQIFDTGCVGFDETVSVDLAPGVTSNSILVEVIPNCAGTSFTGWNYLVGCPGGEAVMVCGGETCECLAPSGNTCPVTDPAPSRVRFFNGCGAADGISLNEFIPRTFRSDFIAVCNIHDRCYGECGTPRFSCDVDFLADLTKVCLQNSIFLLLVQSFKVCLAYASAAYLAVWGFGAGPYEGGQREYCSCDTCF